MGNKKRNIKNQHILSECYVTRPDYSTYEDMEHVDLSIMWTRLLRILTSSPMFNNRMNFAVKYKLNDGTYFYIATDYNHCEFYNFCSDIKILIVSKRNRTHFSLLDWKVTGVQRDIFDNCHRKSIKRFPKEQIMEEIEDFIEDYLVYKN